MKVSELGSVLNFNCVQQDFDDQQIKSAYTSDLLSDVMAHAEADSVLITIQAHKNTIAVAQLVGAKAVIICNDRPIAEDMIEAARQEKIAIFSSTENQFEVSCRLGEKIRA
jgi:phosphoribosylamine-glycine ligase